MKNHTINGRFSILVYEGEKNLQNIFLPIDVPKLLVISNLGKPLPNASAQRVVS
jgi:hypothetical protein